jgi:hypothetical protein
MTQLLNWFQILAALGILGVLIRLLAKVTDKLLDLLIAKTKDQNVKLFLEWVDQAVAQSATVYKDDTNDKKKAEAMDFVVKRLKANNLFEKFSNEQISGAIEKAVMLLNEKV